MLNLVGSGTAKTRPSKILRKLGLRDKTQLAIWAAETRYRRAPPTRRTLNGCNCEEYKDPSIIEET